MKKILLATTMLVAGAGIAAADVTVSGSGRFGLVHYSGKAAGASATTIDHRLTFDITGTKETDAGVTFGGKLRMRNNTAAETTAGNEAVLFAEYMGFRVEVGNSQTAWDSAGLIWASEIGLTSSSYGDPVATGAYGPSSVGTPAATDYEGVFASYSAGSFTARVAYVQPDQTVETLPAGMDDELSVSLDYASGPFAVSFAAVQNAGGTKDADATFLGATYNIAESTKVGLNFIGEADDSRTVVLYGSHTMNAITIAGYVANNDEDTLMSNTAYGLGASYDLGGATVTGALHRDYAEETFADLGVTFSF